MTSTLRIAFGAVALVALTACGPPGGPPDSVFLNDGYEVVRTDGPTSYLFNASTGDCIERTAYQGGVSYQRVPTEDC
jgi:hypothetical protein